jgi:hypothetical protein
MISGTVTGKTGYWMRLVNHNANGFYTITSFIQAEKASYPVDVWCRVLAVARSGYYAWCRGPLGARAQQNQWLMTHIRACYQASRGRYCPRASDRPPSCGPAHAASWAPRYQSTPGLETTRKSRP